MKNIKKLLALSICTLLVGCTAQKEEGIVKDGFRMKELPYEVSNAFIQENGFIMIQDPETDLYGCINMDGEVVIKPEHKNVLFFNEGLCYVSPNRESSYFINEKGEKVIERVEGKELTQAYYFDSSGQAVVAVYDEEKMKDEYFVIDKKGNVLSKNEEGDEKFKIWIDKETNLYEMLYTVKPDKIFEHQLIRDPYAPITFYGNTQSYGIFDNGTKTFVTDLRYESVSGFVKDRAIVTDLKGDMLIIDTQGNVLLNMSEKYPGILIYPFLNLVNTKRMSADRVVVNFEDRSKGAIILDFDGNEIVRTEYEKIGSFMNDYALTFRHGTDGSVLKYGLIDKEGKEVFPQQYDRMGNVSDEKVVLKQDGKWYIADLSKKAE